MRTLQTLGVVPPQLQRVRGSTQVNLARWVLRTQPVALSQAPSVAQATATSHCRGVWLLQKKADIVVSGVPSRQHATAWHFE